MANSTATPAEPLASTELNSALLARGDGLFALGDLSSARMLYERAATAGHGPAALRLGETYDPAFLARTRFIGARANAAIAAYWYQRASELGAPGADILLAAIVAETNHSSP
jgi:TPR repeat protein